MGNNTNTQVMTTMLLLDDGNSNHLNEGDEGFIGLGLMCSFVLIGLATALVDLSDWLIEKKWRR